MIFGPTPLAEALGAVLAHGHRLPGRMLRKGLVLDPEALAALAASGLSEVVTARLEPEDVPEDEAATRLAEALAAPGLMPGRAGTGRVNLHAASSGLFTAIPTRIDAVNAVDEALTVATLPDATPVATGEMVATIKVIPFAVPGPALTAAITAVGSGAVALSPFRPLRVGLVLSTLPGLKNSVLDGTVAATRARVEGLSGTLLPPLRVAHAAPAIARALAELLTAGADMLLVAGASATVDRRDEGPAAVVAAGGVIVHFGMPVDPGNLICVGRIGAVPALVLPGCARSPRPNGIDLVLRRLFAGLPAGGAEIGRMGVGGLLKETPHRPLPRGKAAPAGPAEPPIAAVVLAAGASRRMAPHHKLLLTDRAGRAMIARVVDNVLASSARPIVVVVGHRADEVRAALGARPVRVVVATDFAEGLSASLRTGLAAVPQTARGAVICLGDMPLIPGRTIDRLIAAWDPDEGRTIVAPVHEGQLGNPVLWDRSHFQALSQLSGDRGGRAILDARRETLVEVPVENPAHLLDFDTVESLAAMPAFGRIGPDAGAPLPAGSS